jgi:predicted component of type VI protein secretion system
MNDRRYLFEKLAGIPAQGFDLPRAIASQVERLMTILPIEEPDEAIVEMPHLLNMGLPAIVDLGGCTPVERLRYGQHLQAQLLQFEPRMVEPQISFTSEPLSVEIRAQVTGVDFDGDAMLESMLLQVNAHGMRRS